MSNEYFRSSTVDEAAEQEIILPHFVEFPAAEPPNTLKNLIEHYDMIKHDGGGYFTETDRSPFEISISNDGFTGADNGTSSNSPKPQAKRSMSSLIYSLLTPDAPVGKFLQVKHRTIHILQKGKGQCILVYPDGTIKSFKVGFDYSEGEINQWVVPGGVFKACFLIPNEEFDNGLLISEVVVPGFDFEDVVLFSGKDQLIDLVGQEKAEQLKAFL